MDSFENVITLPTSSIPTNEEDGGGNNGAYCVVFNNELPTNEEDGGGNNDHHPALTFAPSFNVSTAIKGIWMDFDA
ncbi:hypothetical protein CPB83DRAFT_911061 [Crepidotus variabilis]|uniref:Uncharacterized protein n=1 Tax=Crepidotus variabilis TaxID=179855 RepID=A0A9P6E5H2_9AGAR|nr:hypothetical protein CPB83DRAFT_911061 [Crepidotus variabilis]